MRTQSVNLIVDDDPAMCRALSEGLASSGYVTEVAANAEEALSKLDGVSVELALVDFRLPGMKGVALLRELRQRSPATMLVIMTANPSLESAVETLPMGAIDYLLKPFTLNQVREVVSRGLVRRRHRAQRELLLRQLERDLSSFRALELFARADSSAVAVPPAPANTTLLKCGPIEIDVPKHLAFENQRELALRPPSSICWLHWPITPRRWSLPRSCCTKPLAARRTLTRRGSGTRGISITCAARSRVTPRTLAISSPCMEWGVAWSLLDFRCNERLYLEKC